MLIGYARTSTTEQVAGYDSQMVDLAAAGCTKTFGEQTSSVGEREQLDAAIAYLRGGDTLVVCKMDRLARSTLGLWDIIRQLEAIPDGGAALRILNFGGEVVDTKSATGRFMLTVFAGIAQFEREMMLERQAAGIAKARQEGKYKGRKPTASLMVQDIARLRAEGKKPSAIARELGIGRTSVYRAIG